MDQYIKKKVFQFESFINDVLKEDLKNLEDKLNKLNTDAAEFNQLKTTISTIKSVNKSGENGFKTKLDIGNNFYVQANVEDTSTILLDVGLGHFVEFTLDEAILVIDLRLKLLNRQIMNIRNETAKTKAHIKLILFSIRELQDIN